MPSELPLTRPRDHYQTTNRYWEDEEPTTAQAGNVELRHYPNAGKLQIVQVIQNRDGSTRAGRIVTLDMDDLAVSPDALHLLRVVLDDASEGDRRGPNPDRDP